MSVNHGLYCVFTDANLRWAYFIALYGNIGKPIQVNKTGFVYMPFRRRHHNLTSVFFYFHRWKPLLRPNDTVYYWVRFEAMNGSFYDVSPKKFTIVGNGTVID